MNGKEWEMDIEHFENTIYKLKSQKDEYVELKEKVCEMEMHLEKYKLQNANLHEQVASSTRIEMDLVHLKRDYEDTKKENEKLSREVLFSKSKKDALEEQLAIMEDSKRKWQQEMKLLNSKYNTEYGIWKVKQVEYESSIQMEKDKVKQMESRNQEMEKTCSKRLKDILDKHVAEEKTSIEKLIKMQEQLNDFQTFKKDSDTEICRLHEMVGELQNQLCEKEKQFKTLETKFEHTAKALDDESNRKSKMERKFTAKENASVQVMADLKAQIESLQFKCQDHKSQRKEWKQRETQYQQEIQETADRLHIASRQHEIETRNGQVFESELSRLRDTERHQIQKIETLQLSNQQITQDNLLLQSKVDTLLDQLQSERKDRNAWSIARRKLLAQLDLSPL